MRDEITEPQYTCPMCKRDDLHLTSLALKDAHLMVCRGRIHDVHTRWDRSPVALRMPNLRPAIADVPLPPAA
jgi:hypothetical protein